MPVEIERKFLVAGDAWRTDADSGRPVRQGYLSTSDRLNVRVRITNGTHGTLTLKLPDGDRSRLEYEYDIPLCDAEELIGRCDGAIIDKHRHEVVFDDLVWEIDVFDGENRGLVVAEIELRSEEQDFERPGWLGREVTQDPRYRNAHLADCPFSSWPAAPDAQEDR